MHVQKKYSENNVVTHVVSYIVHFITGKDKVLIAFGSK
jgi:hypothetical protein